LVPAAHLDEASEWSNADTGSDQHRTVRNELSSQWVGHKTLEHQGSEIRLLASSLRLDELSLSLEEAGTVTAILIMRLQPSTGMQYSWGSLERE
jgi:hypothetical protein